MFISCLIRRGSLIVSGTLCSTRIPKLWSSQLPFSSNGAYIKTIRAQQKLKQSSKCQDSFYSEGQYMLLDIERDLVLVNANRTSSKMYTLMWRSYGDLIGYGINVKEEAVFLSLDPSDRPQLAVPVSSFKERSVELETALCGKLIPLRQSLFTLSEADCGLVSQSHSLLRWMHCYKFCPSCGGLLKLHTISTQKVCTSCGETHYPTMSPVGIVLVTNEDHSQALLVRQPIFPPGMYSCIAGFIEVGESLEENIRREVAEEVGLAVTHIEYIGSQHWSLPASRLMIACMAAVQPGDLDIDCEELEAAKWLNPQQVRSALDQVTSGSAKVLSEPGKLWVPPRGAIAHDLIKHWLRTYHQ